MIEKGSYATSCMQSTFSFSMAAKKSFFGQLELGSKKNGIPSRMELCPGGIGQVNSVEANILGSIYFLDFGISEEMDVLDVFPISDLPLKMFFLRKRLNGLAGENTVNQMWFQQTNRGDSLPPQRPTFLRSRRGVSRQPVHATKVLNTEKS